MRNATAASKSTPTHAPILAPIVTYDVEDSFGDRDCDGDVTGEGDTVLAGDTDIVDDEDVVELSDDDDDDENATSVDEFVATGLGVWVLDVVADVACVADVGDVVEDVVEDVVDVANEDVLDVVEEIVVDVVGAWIPIVVSTEGVSESQSSQYQ